MTMPKSARPQPCECGCGEMTTPGRRFRAGHNGSRRKSGRSIQDGYVNVWVGHGRREKGGGYKREHRLLVEAHLAATEPDSEFLLNGALHPRVEVHHINEVKTDNRLENLQPMWREDHGRHHHARRWSWTVGEVIVEYSSRPDPRKTPRVIEEIVDGEYVVARGKQRKRIKWDNLNRRYRRLSSDDR
jgi:hypothetical protein